MNEQVMDMLAHMIAHGARVLCSPKTASDLRDFCRRNQTELGFEIEEDDSLEDGIIRAIEDSGFDFGPEQPAGDVRC